MDSPSFAIDIGVLILVLITFGWIIERFLRGSKLP